MPLIFLNQRKASFCYSFSMTMEHGHSPQEITRRLRAAFATFVTSLLASAVPLIPVVAGLPNPFALSVYATLFEFFLIGAGKSRWPSSKCWHSGTETLVIGGLAALPAYGVGGFSIAVERS